MRSEKENHNRDEFILLLLFGLFERVRQIGFNLNIHNPTSPHKALSNFFNVGLESGKIVSSQKRNHISAIIITLYFL